MYLLSSVLLLLHMLQATVVAQDQTILKEATDSSCHNACQALHTSLGPLIHLGPPPVTYSQSFFTHQQRDLIPACIFTPSAPQEIPIALEIIKTYGCPFTIKSGGHARDAGFSNSDGGVSIDLRELNDIALVDDEKEEERVIKVGTGARWGEVYESLDGLNITVIGGRVSSVGVGGFLLGGGISYVSRRYGWGMDNVRNFEVVLANGSIANTNQHSSPDLYWALRGGGNNFGIVTRFDLETYPQGLMWGGFKFHLFSHKDVVTHRGKLGLPPLASLTTLQTIARKAVELVWRAVCRLGYCVNVDEFFEAYQTLTLQIESDPYAHILLGWAYVADVDLHASCSIVTYTKPEGVPTVLKEGGKQPHFYSTIRTASLKNFAEENERLGPGPGPRHLWLAATVKLNATLISRIFDIFLGEEEAMHSVKGSNAAANFQPITREIIQSYRKNGGNPLGIEDEEEHLMVFGIVLWWPKAEDDALMHRIGNTILARSVEEAKKMGLYHPYIYPNYAGAGQDVFGGYGEENRERLLEIQRKYDPEGVFNELQPGGFKLQK